MDLVDRAIWFMLGGGVGFVLGYIVRSLREIKDELNEVDEHVKQLEQNEVDRRRDEKGAFRIRPSMVALVLVVGISVLASIQTGRVNAELNRTVDCLTQFNVAKAESLSTRDTAIRNETQAEIDLWTLYETLYRIAEDNPKKIPIVQKRLNKAIIGYRDELIDTQRERKLNPYPNPDFLANCQE